MRERLVGRRTALINQIRGILVERGIILAKGKPKLLGIPKRGNAYVRLLLIHGARAVIRRLAEKRTRLGQWMRGVLKRRHHNVAVVALANKLARIAWTILAGGTHYTEFVEAR